MPPIEIVATGAIVTLSACLGVAIVGLKLYRQKIRELLAEREKINAAILLTTQRADAIAKSAARIRESMDRLKAATQVCVADTTEWAVRQAKKIEALNALETRIEARATGDAASAAGVGAASAAGTGAATQAAAGVDIATERKQP